MMDTESSPFDTNQVRERPELSVVASFSVLASSLGNVAPKVTASPKLVGVIASFGVERPCLRALKALRGAGEALEDAARLAPFNLASPVMGSEFPGMRLWNVQGAIPLNKFKFVSVDSIWPAFLEAMGPEMEVVAVAPRTLEGALESWNRALKWFHEQTCWRDGVLPSRLKSRVGVWLGMAMSDDGFHRALGARDGVGDLECGSLIVDVSGPLKPKNVWDARTSPLSDRRMLCAIKRYSERGSGNSSKIVGKDTVFDLEVGEFGEFLKRAQKAPKLLVELARWAQVPNPEELTPLVWILASVWHAHASVRGRYGADVDVSARTVWVEDLLHLNEPSLPSSSQQILCGQQHPDNQCIPIPTPSPESQPPKCPTAPFLPASITNAKTGKCAIGTMLTNVQSTSSESTSMLMAFYESIERFGGVSGRHCQKIFLHADPLTETFEAIRDIYDLETYQISHMINRPNPGFPLLTVEKFFVWALPYDRVILMDTDTMVIDDAAIWSSTPHPDIFGSFLQEEHERGLHKNNPPMDEPKYSKDWSLSSADLSSMANVPEVDWMTLPGHPPRQLVAGNTVEQHHSAPGNAGAWVLTPHRQTFFDLLDVIHSEGTPEDLPKGDFGMVHLTAGSRQGEDPNGFHQYGAIPRTYYENWEPEADAVSEIMLMSGQFPRTPAHKTGYTFQFHGSPADQGIPLYLLGGQYRSISALNWESSRERELDNPYWVHFSAKKGKPFLVPKPTRLKAAALWIGVVSLSLEKLSTKNPSSAGTIRNALSRTSKSTINRNPAEERATNLHLLLMSAEEAHEWDWEAEVQKTMKEVALQHFQSSPRKLTITLAAVSTVCPGLPLDEGSDILASIARKPKPSAKDLFDAALSSEATLEVALSRARTVFQKCVEQSRIYS